MVTFFVGYLENHRQNGNFENRFILWLNIQHSIYSSIG